jgi:hypothetical protein
MCTHLFILYTDFSLIYNNRGDKSYRHDYRNCLGLATRWMAETRSEGGPGTFLFTIFSLVLKPIQPSVQWVLEDSFFWSKTVET